MVDQLPPPSPNYLNDVITYGGMLLGGAVATLLVRLGFKKGPVQETELAVTGAATITDMAPIRELLHQLDQLTLHMQQVTAAASAAYGAQANTAEELAKLSQVLGQWIDRQRREDENDRRSREIKDEVDRQVREQVQERLQELEQNSPPHVSRKS